MPMRKVKEDPIVIDFTRQDLRELPNTVSIIKQVSSTHKGLGARVALAKICDIGDQGLLPVGNMGTGKTATLKALKQLRHKRKFLDEDFNTVAGIGSERAMQRLFSNNEVTWITADLSGNSFEVNISTLRLIASLITEHRIKGKTFTYKYHIDNCHLSWFGACDIIWFEEMNKNSIFRGKVMDRIMPYYSYLPPIRKVDRKFPRVNLRIPSIPNLDKIIENVECDKKLRDGIVEELLPIFTKTRCFDYSERMLKSSAVWNERDYVTEADEKFLQLCSFCYAGAFINFSERDSPSDSLYYDMDGLQVLSNIIENRKLDIEKYCYIRRCTRESAILVLSNYPEIFEYNHDWCKISDEFYQDFIAPPIEIEKYLSKTEVS